VVSFYYAYTLCRRTTKFEVVTNVGEGVRLGVSDPSHPKRAEFQRSPILELFLYLCLHALTQNDQILYDNQYGEAVLLRGQPRH